MQRIFFFFERYSKQKPKGGNYVLKRLHFQACITRKSRGCWHYGGMPIPYPQKVFLLPFKMLFFLFQQLPFSVAVRTPLRPFWLSFSENRLLFVNTDAYFSPFPLKKRNKKSNKEFRHKAAKCLIYALFYMRSIYI